MNLRTQKGKSLLAFFDDYVIIDLETTGLDFSCDIIELSALKIKNGKISAEFSSLVQPLPFFSFKDNSYHYIDSYITDLTGITDDMLAAASSLKQVAPSFFDFIGDSLVVGHNIASFDSNFLYDAFEKVLDKPFQNDFVDTMRLSRWLLPELSHHRLADLAEYYNIEYSVMHRGLADCNITNQCYNFLKQEAINKYNSLDSFYTYVKNKLSKKAYALNAKDITTTNQNFDVSNPLYNAVCVFTGTLDKMPRRQAMQIVVDLGGKVGDTVTKKTNFLVLGNNDFCSTIKDGKSAKQKKAEKLSLEGQDISIISEDVFYEMAGISY